LLGHKGELSGIVDLSRAEITHPAQDWALALRSMRRNFGAEQNNSSGNTCLLIAPVLSYSKDFACWTNFSETNVGSIAPDSRLPSESPSKVENAVSSGGARVRSSGPQ
jgi:hypothetical protein